MAVNNLKCTGDRRMAPTCRGSGAGLRLERSTPSCFTKGPASTSSTPKITKRDELHLVSTQKNNNYLKCSGRI